MLHKPDIYLMSKMLSCQMQYSMQTNLFKQRLQSTCLLFRDLVNSAPLDVGHRVATVDNQNQTCQIFLLSSKTSLGTHVRIHIFTHLYVTFPCTKYLLRKGKLVSGFIFIVWCGQLSKSFASVHHFSSKLLCILS